MSPVGIASLSTTHVGYFTAIATVIPVFLVAYVIGLGKVVSALLPRAERGWRVALRAAYVAGRAAGAKAAGAKAPRRPARQRLRPAAQAALGGATALVITIAVQLLLVVAIVVPALGEYIALHALYVDHSSRSDEQFCLVAASISGLIVVVPLMLRGLQVTLGFGMLPELVQLFREDDQRHSNPIEEARDSEVPPEPEAVVTRRRSPVSPPSIPPDRDHEPPADQPGEERSHPAE